MSLASIETRAEERLTDFRQEYAVSGSKKDFVEWVNGKVFFAAAERLSNPLSAYVLERITKVVGKLDERLRAAYVYDGNTPYIALVIPPA